jgi:hypothetical protein
MGNSAICSKSQFVCLNSTVSCVCLCCVDDYDCVVPLESNQLTGCIMDFHKYNAHS